MLSAISFGVFCRSAPSTSAIIRSRNVSPGLDGDLDPDPVGQHLRAAGHRRAVAARLADDRRGLAGDGALVDRRDALDDFAVGGNDLARRDADDVALAERRRRHGLVRAVRALALGDGLGLGLAQRIGLRLAAPLGHRLREVGEEHRQPEPERDLQLEAERWHRRSRASRTRRSVVRTLPISTTNITGLRAIVRGCSLRNESPTARCTICGSQIEVGVSGH